MSLIVVTSKRDGFHRGGRAWSGTPTTVDTDEFTPEQLAQIEAEPMLTVRPAGKGDPEPDAVPGTPADNAEVTRLTDELAAEKEAHGETRAKLEAAEKRVAELEAAAGKTGDNKKGKGSK